MHRAAVSPPPLFFPAFLIANAGTVVSKESGSIMEFKTFWELKFSRLGVEFSVGKDKFSPHSFAAEAHVQRTKNQTNKNNNNKKAGRSRACRSSVMWCSHPSGTPLLMQCQEYMPCQPTAHYATGWKTKKHKIKRSIKAVQPALLTLLHGIQGNAP